MAHMAYARTRSNDGIVLWELSERTGTRLRQSRLSPRGGGGSDYTQIVQR
jgi:hypothetical protein